MCISISVIELLRKIINTRKECNVYAPANPANLKYETAKF